MLLIQKGNGFWISQLLTRREITFNKKNGRAVRKVVVKFQKNISHKESKLCPRAILPNFIYLRR